MSRVADTAVVRMFDVHITLSTADLIGERYRRGGPVGGIGWFDAERPAAAAAEAAFERGDGARARWLRLRPVRAGDRRGSLMRFPAGCAR